MRTHDIVAVKVVKNKPAYLNQSKMEVAILDLVSISALMSRMTLTPSAQQRVGQARRTPHSADARELHAPQTSLFGVRMPFVQLIRAHQAESVPGVEHSTRQGFHAATPGCAASAERSSLDPL
jgi:hypothetical protein